MGPPGEIPLHRTTDRPALPRHPFRLHVGNPMGGAWFWISRHSPTFCPEMRELHPAFSTTGPVNQFQQSFSVTGSFPRHLHVSSLWLGAPGGLAVKKHILPDAPRRMANLWPTVAMADGRGFDLVSQDAVDSSRNSVSRSHLPHPPRDSSIRHLSRRLAPTRSGGTCPPMPMNRQ
jgi:hypothetical protein